MSTAALSVLLVTKLACFVANFLLGKSALQDCQCLLLIKLAHFVANFLLGKSALQHCQCLLATMLARFVFGTNFLLSASTAALSVLTRD